MTPYDWILFDADDTLFHFDDFSGLTQTFLDFDLHFTQDDYAEYKLLNTALWEQYQQGSIGADEIKQGRFTRWSQSLGISASEMNQSSINNMAKISIPLPGAMTLLNALQGQFKLGIITNGFTQLQELRLINTGLKQHFDLIVISEEVGFAKPHQGIFEHALTLMNNPPRKRVLMVGDNLHSDILGGLNAGLDTCWFNSNNKPSSLTIQPMFQIASLNELIDLLIT